MCLLTTSQNMQSRETPKRWQCVCELRHKTCIHVKHLKGGNVSANYFTKHALT